MKQVHIKQKLIASAIVGALMIPGSVMIDVYKRQDLRSLSKLTHFVLQVSRIREKKLKRHLRVALRYLQPEAWFNYMKIE